MARHSRRCLATTRHWRRWYEPAACRALESEPIRSSAARAKSRSLEAVERASLRALCARLLAKNRAQIADADSRRPSPPLTLRISALRLAFSSSFRLHLSSATIARVSAALSSCLLSSVQRCRSSCFSRSKVSITALSACFSWPSSRRDSESWSHRC